MSSDPGASASHPGADESYSGWVGRVVDGRYRIDGLLGEGGMGAVFEAEHLKLMKQVALKVIHPEFAGDGEVAERFAREAMASAQMDHPHIAGAIDYGTLAEGGAYLVMQFVRGQALRDVIEDEGALGWVRACEIGAQIADALTEAHKRKIVHRDLKPDNVMLEPRDDGSTYVKVLDFGIARVADEKIASGGPALTRIGTVIGTPGYMAPEQALGEPVDDRVDIYALGLLIFEMVTGERVFDLDDLTAIVTRQLTEDAPRLSERVSDVPEALDELVAKMLTKDREGRPGPVAEVRDALKALLLEATLQAAASGLHKLPNLSALELAGAVRDPTPLRVETQAAEVNAPTMAARAVDRGTIPGESRREPSSAFAKDVPSKEARRKVATAMTELGRPAARDPAVTSALDRLRSLPVPQLAGLGCAALLAVAVALVGVPLLLFGGEPDLSDLPKQEHAGPITPEGEEEEEPIEEEPVAADEPPTIPAALLQANAHLLTSDRDATRRRAAREVLRHEPREAVPEFLVELAEIETTRGCDGKKEHVLRLQQLGDLRALPALERMADEPRNTCGNLFRRYDCYRCMRDELDAAVEGLRSRM